MKLTVLASGSVANSYLIHNENEVLLIEAGVRLSKVKQALNFDLSHIVGCLVSHAHGDHSRGIKEYMDAGITVVANSHVFDTVLPQGHHNARLITEGRGIIIGGFKVRPLPVSHDVPCHAFIIDHQETGKILFMTDSFMSEYIFPSLHHILIETNYCDEVLMEKISCGATHPAMRKRLMETHMELQTCKGILRANNLTNVMNIVLLHLSSENSDEARFIREVKEVTGKQVYAASKGLEIDLNINPY